MTKKEIYEYLDYKGIYDNGVKKRLKKLIKKYHPDRNNGDDTTMKIINEVKKELECGIDYKIDNTDIKETNFKKTTNKYDITILNIINTLNQEIENLNEMLKEEYHDEYELYKEYNSSLALYNALMLNKKILKKEIINLKRFNKIDKFNIFLLCVFIVLLVISKYFIVGVLSVLYIEIIYLMVRYNIRNKKKKELNSIDMIDDEYEKTMIDVKKKIALLNKKIFDTKHKKNKKRESIIRYEKMFNDDSGEEVLYNKNAKK